MENVGQFATWARNSRLEFLTLLGGEPFLHPKLGEIVKLIRQTCPGTRMRILTGGVFNKHCLDDLSPQEVALGFNVNEPRDYQNPKHFAKVINNIEMAILKGFVVTLSFNVWRPDFDVSFMPNLAHRFARSCFSWTVANPVIGFHSNVVNTTQYNSLTERCVSMLQKSAVLNIGALLDCPLPLCFFKDSVLGWVRQYHPDTSANLGVCEPSLDVTPELEVIRCFALSKLTRVKLRDFQSEREIKEWFRENIDHHLLDRGCFPHCNECSHFLKGKCFGGCLARHDGTTEPGGDSPVIKLVRQMNGCLEAGKPDTALSLYETAGYWWKIGVPTYLAAIAAFRMGKWDLAYRFASEANDQARDPVFMRKVGDLLRSLPLDKIRSPSVDQLVNNTLMPFVTLQRLETGE